MVSGQNGGGTTVSEYALRDIDPDLWKRVKSKAAYEGRTLKFVLMELLRVYADHGFHVVETFDGKNRK